MEQHMYTFLNHRFGLKSLIIEYLENGLREDPSTTGRKQHYDFDRSQKGSDD